MPRHGHPPKTIHAALEEYCQSNNKLKEYAIHTLGSLLKNHHEKASALELS